MSFIIANKMALLAIIYQILNLVNASLKDSKEKNIIGAIINSISYMTRSDAPGTIKLPLGK